VIRDFHRLTTEWPTVSTSTAIPTIWTEATGEPDFPGQVTVWRVSQSVAQRRISASEMWTHRGPLERSRSNSCTSAEEFLNFGPLLVGSLNGERKFDPCRGHRRNWVSPVSWWRRAWLLDA
jgi:hypothetical protein